MKQIKKILMLALLTFSTMATAASYVDVIDVLGSEAIYTDVQTQQPYQHCYQVRKNSGSATNELIGGILGGAIGNQFGGGDGKKITTIAGSLLGASIANDIEKSQDAQGNTGHTKQVCETRYRNENSKRFSHYLVHYKYKGAKGYYKSSQNPIGEATVLVNISVEALPPGYQVKTKKEPFKKVSNYFKKLIN